MSKILGVITVGVLMAACDPTSDKEEAILAEKEAILEEAGLSIEEPDFRVSDPCQEAIGDAYRGFMNAPSGSDAEEQYLDLLIDLLDFCYS